jgi:transcriptional regulator with XRE-family HTH domain
MTNSEAQLGQPIRQRREDLGLSQRQLGERIGSTGSGTTIMRIESGEIANPRVDVLTALAEALDLPSADLFAAAGYAVPNELPSFRPYLRAKYQDLPPEAVTELEDTFADIAKRYGTNGPAPGEDER